MNANEMNLYYGNDEKIIKKLIGKLDENYIPYRFEEDQDNPVISSDENPYINIFVSSYEMEKASIILNEITLSTSTDVNPIESNTQIPDELLEGDENFNEETFNETEEEKYKNKVALIGVAALILVLIISLILLYILLK